MSGDWRSTDWRSLAIVLAIGVVGVALLASGIVPDIG